MAWIKKENNVEVSKELEYSNNSITETNAYEVEITECRLANSQTAGSKSMSLVVGVKTEDGLTNKTFFTIMGKDGNTYFESTVAGKKVKKQHFGLSISDTLFKILLGKEIFDAEPEDVTYQVWNNESKELETEEGQGFPQMIGKKVGICLQMIRTIQGADSKETGTIEHFFDCETGLFADEPEDTPKRKLDKWLGSMKDFKVITKEVQSKSSFGKKETLEEPKKSKWGK